MSKTKRRTPKILAIAATAALAASFTTPATAAPTVQYFNPFDVNNGFTILSKTDIGLDNLELEGAVAAFGKVSTTLESATNEDGYHIIHSSAGLADYTVPSIDGVPVRLLANEFTGSGTLSIFPEDVSHTITSTSPEYLAGAKLAQTDGLTWTAAGPDAYTHERVDDFLRIKNTTGGTLNLKSVEGTAETFAAVQTAESSVSDYFPNFEARTAAMNQCLADMYTLPDDYINNLTVSALEGNNVSVSGAVKDRVNILDYEDIRGKNLNFADSSWEPSDNGPLVIRVPAETTKFLDFTVQGWAGHTGPQQAFGRNILIDMSTVDSAVVGDVIFENSPFGALWAPNANVIAKLGTTTNGQWHVNDLDLSQSGEYHHQSFSGLLPCMGEEPVTLASNAVVDGTADNVLPITGGTVTDTIHYTGLTPGTTYTVNGTIVTVADSTPVGVTSSATFTPTASSGSAQVEFTIADTIAAAFADQQLVVFEVVSDSNGLVVAHQDPNDVDQQFKVAPKVTVPEEPEPTPTPTPEEPEPTPTPTPEEPEPTPTPTPTPTPELPFVPDQNTDPSPGQLTHQVSGQLGDVVVADSPAKQSSQSSGLAATGSSISRALITFAGVLTAGGIMLVLKRAKRTRVR